MKLPSLQGVRVLVVGDVMLDRYWVGDAERVSQEAPVPVVAVTGQEDRPGGAANVALNVVSMGAACTLVGVVGVDAAAQALRETLEAAGVTCDLVAHGDWSTTIKLRILSQNQQLLRADFESAPPGDLGPSLYQKVADHIGEASALVLQDYDKGTLEAPDALIRMARARQVPVIVDPKHKPFRSYAGASIIKPNMQEFNAAVGPAVDDDELARQALALCREHEFEAVVVTRGSLGMVCATGSGEHRHIPARPVDVFDVTGAGDTATASLGIGAALGWDPMQGAMLANVAAGIAVGKSRTAAVTGPELAIALATAQRVDTGVLSRKQLVDAVDQARVAGERVVFTNGCFDILHAGHVSYLEQARSLGDRLVVAVNDDASVARLKGAGRPVNPLAGRMRVLAALQAVDWVVSFPEDTPEDLLRETHPEVLVKGGDYTEATVVGADIVHGYGGSVKVVGLLEDCSTSAVLERVRQR